MNVNNPYKTFTENFDSLLNTCAALKKISKNKLKFQGKNWITSDLRETVSLKNR